MPLLPDLYVAELPRIDAAIARELKALSPPLRPVAEHIAFLPGKRLRPLFCLTLGRCFGSKDDSIYPLVAALEILHCATLLHDDILDRAEVRRGVTAAHLKFGEKLSILAGDAMFALAGGIIAGYGRPRLMRVFSSAVQCAAEGQALEASRLFDPSASATHYLEVAAGKTAALFEASALCGAELADAPSESLPAVANFAFNFGMAFQILDDLLDFFPSQTTGKTWGKDLLEGKLTAPVLCWLALSEPGEQKKFLNKFSQKKLTEADISALDKRLQASEVPRLIREKAEFFCLQAKNGLKQLPSNQYQSILYVSIDFLLRQGHAAP